MQIMASGQCFAQADVKEATMLALVLNRSSRVIPKTQPGQDFKLPRVTIMGRKSNQIKSSILLWTDTHQLLVPQIKNKFSSCSNELAPEISPFQEQPAQVPIVRNFTGAAWSTVTTQPTPAVLRAAQLLPKWILLPLLSHFQNYSLNANCCMQNVAGCVSGTPHCYCSNCFNHQKWRFRKS